mgnify:CR=1 FL=1
MTGDEREPMQPAEVAADAIERLTPADWEPLPRVVAADGTVVEFDDGAIHRFHLAENATITIVVTEEDDG